MTVLRALCFGIVVVLLSPPAFGEPAKTNALIADGQKLATQYGNRLWPGFSQTAFPVLVLEETGERLLCADTPPDGFVVSSIEPITNCSVHTRSPGVFPTHLQATFALPNTGPVVVMGAPALSEASPAAWVATLVHEHFHQYQMSWPGYFTNLHALDLHSGDETGMWAIHYPFAYTEPVTQTALAQLSRQLINILAEPQRNIRRAKAQAYARQRPGILSALSDTDRRYLEFQLWQEGVARYTEMVLVEYAAAGKNGPHDFAALAANLRERITTKLTQEQLSKHQRVYFYSLGAAESLVLDELGDQWRARYFAEPFSMARFFSDAIKVHRAPPAKLD